MFQKSIYAVLALLLVLCSVHLTSYATDSDTLWCKYTYPTNIYAVKFTPDGQYLATGGSNGVVTIWNALTGDSVKSYTNDGEIYSLDISSDGRLIAMSYFIYGNQNNGIKVYNLQTDSLLITLQGMFLKFSSDGNYLVTNTGKIYNTQTWNESGSFTTMNHNIVSIDISADNNYIATAYYLSDGNTKGIALYKLSNLQDTARYILGQEGDINTTKPRVCFSPDDKYLATSSVDDTIRIWTLPDRTIYRKFCHYNEVDAIAFSPDGKYLVEGGGYIANIEPIYGK